MNEKNSQAFAVDQLIVNYGQATALWDLSFSLTSGQLIGVVGPNGAGKSTLLKAAIGLIRPLSGKISFFGKPFKKIGQKVAYVPQRRAIDWDFPITVFEVVLMGRYRHQGFFKWPRISDKMAAMEMLERLGMKEFAHRQIDQLSGGQQQRLFIARALLQEAELYLLDEPFAGVDLATEKMIVGILKQLKEKGKTIIIVHHNLHSVEEYFDSVVILNTSLIGCGPTREVFHAKNLSRAYGTQTALFEEATKLSREKLTGIK